MNSTVITPMIPSLTDTSSMRKKEAATNTQSDKEAAMVYSLHRHELHNLHSLYKLIFIVYCLYSMSIIIEDSIMPSVNTPHSTEWHLNCLPRDIDHKLN